MAIGLTIMKLILIIVTRVVGQELVKLVNHLEEAPTAYGMQISAEKT